MDVLRSKTNLTCFTGFLNFFCCFSESCHVPSLQIQSPGGECQLMPFSSRLAERNTKRSIQMKMLSSLSSQGNVLSGGRFVSENDHYELIIYLYFLAINYYACKFCSTWTMFTKESELGQEEALDICSWYDNIQKDSRC